MSNERVKGTIGVIGEKNFKGKTLYSVKLDEDDRWFGFGDDHPGADKGAVISFEVYQNNRGYWQADASTVKKEAPAPAAAASNRGSAGGSGDSRQMSIVYQSSRSFALGLVDLYLKNDLVSLPAKKADKQEFVRELVNEETDLAYHRAMNFDYEGKASDLVEESAEDVNPEPTEGDI